MKRFIIILFLLCGLVGKAQDKNYYVSQTDGNDSYTSEQAQNPATPWKTLGKADDLTYQPDDTIFLKRGDSWQEKFEPKGDGTDGHQIVITAYGTGAKPLIHARDTVIGWSGVGNWSKPWPVEHPNVWYQYEARTPLYWYAFRMWFDGTEEQMPEDFPPTAEWPWYWYEDDSLFVYSETNPATAFTSIEKANTIYAGIILSYDDYFTLSYLDIRYFIMPVEVNNSTGLIVDSCDITGRYAINLTTTTDVIIRNCDFDTGVNFISGYEAKNTEDGLKIRCGCSDFDIYNNYFNNWQHTSWVMECFDHGLSIDNIKIHDNYITSTDIDYGGRIAADYYNGTGNEWYRNHIHNISITNQIHGPNLKVYYNIFDGVDGPEWRAGYGRAISITGYSSDTRPENMKFYNNIIANTENEGIYFSHYAGRATKKNIEFVNNIFYNTGEQAIYVMDEDSIYNLTFKNNLFYDSGSEVNDIYYRGTTMNIATFNTSDSNDDVISDNIFGNPLFGSGFILNDGSPAINAGIDVGLTEDFLGKSVPYGALPDIGAYEFYDTPSLGTTTFGKTLDGLKYLKDQNGNYIKIIK